VRKGIDSNRIDHECRSLSNFPFRIHSNLRRHNFGADHTHEVSGFNVRMEISYVSSHLVIKKRLTSFISCLTCSHEFSQKWMPVEMGNALVW
jgi:hypothetical protein